MKLIASDAALEALTTTVADSRGGARIAAMVELAWHLRQRDSTRGSALVDEAQALLTDLPMAVAATHLLLVRMALTRSEIAALFGDVDAAAQHVAEARRHLSATPDADTETDAWLVEAALAKARGERKRELEMHERAVAAAKAGKDVARIAIASAWSAYERAFARPDEASIAAMLNPADLDPDSRRAVATFIGAAEALTLSRREPARAAELFLRASDDARSAGLLRHAVVCTMNAGTALQGLGEYHVAADCFEQAANAARETGWPALLGMSQTRLGAFLRELGFLDESRSVLTDALQSLAATSTGINKANACSALAQTLLAMGLGVEAIDPMAEAIRMYREARSTDNLALSLIGQARALSGAGRPQQALTAIEEVRALIGQFGFDALGIGVDEALYELHHRHKLPPPPGMTAPSAAIHYAEATLRGGLQLAGWKAPASLLIFLADAWAAAGDMTRAFEYARKAITAQEQDAGQKLTGPMAMLRLRRQEAARNDELRGVAPAVDRELAGQATGRRSGKSNEAVPKPLLAQTLTRKEREILRLLARNYSNKEIATTLEVSDETVKWHLKNVFNKLEAGSRKHAVNRARTLGVIAFSS